MPTRLLRLSPLCALAAALCGGYFIVFTLPALIPPHARWPAARAVTLLHVPPALRPPLALVKSRRVLKTALRDPKVANLPGVRGAADPVDWLKRRLSVDFDLAPDILRISVRAANEQEALALATAVRDAYLRVFVGKENAPRWELDLKKWQSEARRELMKWQSELRTAQLELKVFEAKEKAARKKAARAKGVAELLPQLKEARLRQQEKVAFLQGMEKGLAHEIATPPRGASAYSRRRPSPADRKGR